MAKLKLAYGCRSDVEGSINLGKIPPGTMILTKDTNELLFYDLDCKLESYHEKNKFSSKLEADAWVATHDCCGSIVTVRVGTQCQVYVVDYENNLVKFESQAPDFENVQSDWSESDPTSPAFIKNKPEVVTPEVAYSTSEDILNLFN